MLSQEDVHNTFTDDWVILWYQCFTINWYRVQSNLDYPDLDYPDFSIIRTLFSGPNFCMNINKLSSSTVKDKMFKYHSKSVFKIVYYRKKLCISCPPCATPTFSQRDRIHPTLFVRNVANSRVVLSLWLQIYHSVINILFCLKFFSNSRFPNIDTDVVTNTELNRKQTCPFCLRVWCPDLSHLVKLGS